MPTRDQTVRDAIQVFEQSTYPTGSGAETSWLGIYQTLLWYEPVNLPGLTSLPHIIDSDKLRPSTPIKLRAWTRPNAWQRRGQLLNAYLAGQLGCPVDEVANHVDLLMKQPDYLGMQRQNTLGIAFVGLVKHTLEKFGSPAVSYNTEIEATHPVSTKCWTTHA